MKNLNDTLGKRIASGDFNSIFLSESQPDVVMRIPNLRSKKCLGADQYFLMYEHAKEISTILSETSIPYAQTHDVGTVVTKDFGYDMTVPAMSMDRVSGTLIKADFPEFYKETSFERGLDLLNNLGERLKQEGITPVDLQGLYVPELNHLTLIDYDGFKLE